ncbi:hypothetical protein H5T88_09360 [bacterium]|nr:hypothetical protein [bacterium]
MVKGKVRGSYRYFHLRAHIRLAMTERIRRFAPINEKYQMGFARIISFKRELLFFAQSLDFLF